MTTLRLASTNLNLRTSRSHHCMAAILMLFISTVPVISGAVVLTNKNAQPSMRSHNIRSVPDSLSQLPWYVNGKVLPEPQSPRLPLLPEEAPDDDRIISQLMHVPQKVTGETKKILIWDKERFFSAKECPFVKCEVTEDRNEFSTTDAIIFTSNPLGLPTTDRKPHQIWILETIESPMNDYDEINADIFNWTSTYRHDSDIVYPYDKWAYYDENVRQAAKTWNVAANKTKKVAWYVSNCDAQSNRLEYANELSKYIEVDIYGHCGTKQCQRSHADDCLKMLKNEYKFYLSFENSICEDYVTEKFFYALRYSILPIAMGATQEYYKKIAPEHSYIHVDDFNSPKELAEYLHELDKNDDLYNNYFRWHGTGKFLDAHSFYICRVCSMLHSDLPPKSYADVNLFKNKAGECSFRPQGVGAPKRGIQYW